MNIIIQNLQKNNKLQVIISTIMSIVNLTIIGIFSTLIIEISKIREKASVISQDENLLAYFMTLIVISIMIILFSLWIIAIIHQTIFNSRKNFNIQLRLAGISIKKLALIYIKESWRLQILVVPIGITLMEVVYHFISISNEISTPWISIQTVILSVIIHLVAISICLLLTLSRLLRFDPVEELRSPFKVDRVRTLGKRDLITGIIGVIFITYGYITPLKEESLLQLLPLVGIFLVFDLIMVSMQYLLKFIGSRGKILSLYLAQGNILGYYKKISPIFTTLIVGVMVSMGLVGLFNTARVISRDTVEQNVYFKNLIVNSDVKEYMTQEQYENKVRQIDINAKLAYGINLELKDADGIINTISCIDSDYMKYGEKFVLTDGTNPENKLNDASFNGIYLPEYFISDDDIGKPYELTINGNVTKFVIAGRFVANGSRGRYGFVSKAYSQTLMGGIEMVNALYIAQGTDALITNLKEDTNVKKQIFISKESIANNSYENSISGTEIFEISSFVVIIISLLMLIHYLVTNSSQNVFDIARFRALGVSSKILKGVYFGQVISIVTQSFIFGSLLAYSFINIGIGMILKYIDVPIKARLPIQYVLITYCIVVVIGVFMANQSIKRAFKPQFTEYLTIIS